MIEEIADAAPERLLLHDVVIDVRSPAEFAGDHIPGAVNLPVLSNEERAEVGAIYVRESRFRARRMGAAYVARNVARHLETALADKGPKFRPLLYCWRGGMRSQAMATILSQIGWRVGVLAGGYRTWRREVVASLVDSAAPLKVVLIDGETGSAKTEIITRLKALGVQAIDLEALAAHRGSVFGADRRRAQPSQKMFESLLHAALRAFDPARPLAVEAESTQIGRLVIPKRLRLAMLSAPRLEFRADAGARAAYLTKAYADLVADPAEVVAAIGRLRPFHPKERIEDFLALAGEGRHAALAEALVTHHYDPLYARSRKRREGDPLGVIRIDRLDTDGLDRAARAAAAAISAL